ncbi:MAG TPA: carboxymuconolactone decarboxylase family protein [Acidimicrobiales bacterium]|nr:carboxymuconolactone decarboxylase family protein [Acidimicrobiales bacterium]
MGVAELKERLPDYAKDLRLNLDSATGPTSGLGEQRLWGTVLASAVAARGETALRELEAEARQHLSETAVGAAKAAAAVMAMNNVYYRSKHLLSDAGVHRYDDLPARLRMQVIGTHGGVEEADFELWCLAVSAINGCGACLVAHDKTVQAAGVTREEVHEVLRLASIVHAVAVTVESEEALAGVRG